MAVGVVLALGPLLLAVVGPALVPLVDQPRAAPYSSADGHPFGTDQLGRDVLAMTLAGGRSMLVLAAVATVAAYTLGIALGAAAAATRRRWLDDLLSRPLDILLAVPSLLILLLVATLTDRGAGMVVLVVALVNAPAIARIVRAVGLDALRSPAAEAMHLQGERWVVVTIGHLVRVARRPLLADLGARITAAVYLVGAANFLGVGLPPTAADWAVAVDRNRAGLLLQPWAVLLPAVLIVLFTVGVNLCADTLTRRRR
ncbi:ABC transporter permease subunit [Natronosporangium hydrolyticum]|uniref:ABC transporter permease subunit n=1 Tax=Natronosporangium hydrolyticum TaxID=2811111 RepID=A0A895YI04_9ACTN|nr:ABC transporter permease subunit [Natronosporangium hydrolyticum]